MIRSNIHLFLHALVPAIVAAAFYREKFLRVWLTLMATMIVDVDHVFADPIYDAGRCSIGFHPLHTYPVFVAYGVAALWPRLRIIVLGLFIHMALDGVDCIWIAYE
jgi:hypothetical protein